MKDKKYFNEETMRYRVKTFDPCKKLKSGVAYIIEEKELVLPFRGKIKNKSKTSGTGIYELKREDEDSVYYIVLPFGKKKKKYTLDNIYKMDETYINNILEEENLSIDNDILLLDTGDVYCPPIYDNDNILQKIIKDALSRKKIDLKAYANRFDNPTDMNNHKRSLMKHDMTEKKFRRWCSILDIDFEIRYKDKTGCLNPMGEGYVGRSSLYTNIKVDDKDGYIPEEDEDDIFTPDEDTKDFETGEF